MLISANIVGLDTQRRSAVFLDGSAGGGSGRSLETEVIPTSRYSSIAWGGICADLSRVYHEFGSCRHYYAYVLQSPHVVEGDFSQSRQAR